MRTFALVGCFIFLLTCVALGQTPAPGDRSPPARRDTQRISVLLTISGGISLGSYEAGVNWALLELFKLTARDSIRRAWNLPRYDLKAMAGASAGNINGFLAAIEWCRTREAIAPEHSLLWKIWVRTGFDQLFPLERYDQLDSTNALFSRRYFRQVLFDTVRAAMQEVPPADSLDGCTIPVGVTITKLTPGQIPISRDIDAVTQRYAAAVLVGRRGRSLRFLAPPADLLGTGKLGALLLLPDCDGAVDPDDVFALVEASSAFPGAFAPVSLRHEASLGAGCDTRASDAALFSDGGLFDNNPVDLAAGIYADAIWKNASRPDSNAMLVFIDPDALRGRLADAKAQRERDPPATGGIAALLELFAGAVPAARQYELQAFGRLLARAPYVFQRDNIQLTNRRFIVVGQQLGAFAAFLGQPFREYDFYVGVYDALSFIAGEACRGADSLCQRDRLLGLVETEHLDLGPAAVPRTLLRALFQREYLDTAPAPAPAPSIRFDSTTPPREVMLLSLLQAHLQLDDQAFDNRSCLGHDVIVRMLCRDGFREMLGRVATDSVLLAIARAGERQPDCTPGHWLESPVRCEVGESFHAFVRNPERFMASRIGLMLHQLWRVERARRRAGEQAWTDVATLSEVVYQSGIGYRYRRGFDANTSSVPRGSGRGWIATLIPNYATISLLSPGFEVGYRPTLHLGKSLSIGLTGAPLHVTGDPATAIDRVRWVVGPALHWKRSSAVWSGLETGVEYVGRWRHGKQAAPVWAVPVTAYLLADKLRIGFRFLPGNDSAVHGSNTVALTFGLADVNGLVYWMLRKS
ncbi:MAG: patatin-like phospholipase family protein [Gemmatimonadales bacterium]